MIWFGTSPSDRAVRHDPYWPGRFGKGKPGSVGMSCVGINCGRVDGCVVVVVVVVLVVVGGVVVAVVVAVVVVAVTGGVCAVAVGVARGTALVKV